MLVGKSACISRKLNHKRTIVKILNRKEYVSSERITKGEFSDCFKLLKEIREALDKDVENKFSIDLWKRHLKGCFYCGKYQHMAKDCPSKTKIAEQALDEAFNKWIEIVAKTFNNLHLCFDFTKVKEQRMINTTWMLSKKCSIHNFTIDITYNRINTLYYSKANAKKAGKRISSYTQKKINQKSKAFFNHSRKIQF